MSPLNIHPEENVSSAKKKNNKMLKVMLGIGALVLVPVIGTTLASSITVNGGTDPITFGQGQQAALACDPDVTLTPVAGYSYGRFVVKSVQVSSVDLNACAGKKVQISAADTATGAEQEIGLIDPTIAGGDFPVAATALLSSGSEACAAYFTCTYNSGSASLLIEINDLANSISADLIGKLLIQQTE
jgi:hypothetical protein